MGIRRILTSAFHPQTNGAVEKFNSTLCRDSSAFALRSELWDEQVALACYRYSSAVHSATKCSPFRTMFGVKAYDFGVDHNLRLKTGI